MSIKTKLVPYTAVVFTFLTPLFVAATDTTFAPLSPALPIIGNVKTMPELLNGMVGLSIAVASILAVVMLTVGGFKYMTTDSAFQMGSAKEQIANAIIGLLIVLMAILLLKTINPNLISLDILQNTDVRRIPTQIGDGEPDDGDGEHTPDLPPPPPTGDITPTLEGSIDVGTGTNPPPPPPNEVPNP